MGLDRDSWGDLWKSNGIEATARVVGPPRANGGGVSIDFVSLCMVFYSMSCVSRRAYGPLFTGVLSCFCLL